MHRNSEKKKKVTIAKRQMPFPNRNSETPIIATFRTGLHIFMDFFLVIRVYFLKRGYELIQV